jgi:hypothetical protein
MPPPTPPVGPIKETHVQLAYDTDSGGFGGPLDMRGPLVGEVTYVQPGGNLGIRINLEFGQPNTKYEVFLSVGQHTPPLVDSFQSARWQQTQQGPEDLGRVFLHPCCKQHLLVQAFETITWTCWQAWAI